MRKSKWTLWLLGFLLSLLLYPAASVLAACAPETASAPGGLVWPLRGNVINGWTLDCATDRGHRGIDIGADPGDTVVAAAGGVVSFAGYTPAEGGGLTLSITHDGGLRSTYLHLRETSVSKGQAVAAGEPIGTSDGSPLHFGLKLPGERDLYLDPLAFLPAMTEPQADAPGATAEVTPAAGELSTPVPAATVTAAEPSAGIGPEPATEPHAITIPGASGAGSPTRQFLGSIVPPPIHIPATSFKSGVAALTPAGLPGATVMSDAVPGAVIEPSATSSALSASRESSRSGTWTGLTAAGLGLALVLAIAGAGKLAGTDQDDRIPHVPGCPTAAVLD